MSMTVKATLLKAGEDEIRRFPVPADVSSSFEYLRKKIFELFSDLRNGNFNLLWKGIYYVLANTIYIRHIFNIII